MNFAAQTEVAPSWEHPGQWFQTNTVALAQLVTHLRHRASAPVRAYSVPVRHLRGRVTGTAPLNHMTPYAASKAAADLSLETFHRQFGFPLLTARPTSTARASSCSRSSRGT